MQHTIGPWRAEGPDQFGDFNILPPSKTLAVAAVVSNLRKPAEVAANASLVAAAPGMREALKSAPDIAMYQPDEFFRLYTTWFEQTRRDALKSASKSE